MVKKPNTPEGDKPSSSRIPRKLTSTISHAELKFPIWGQSWQSSTPQASTSSSGVFHQHGLESEGTESSSQSTATRSRGRGRGSRGRARRSSRSPYARTGRPRHESQRTRADSQIEEAIPSTSGAPSLTVADAAPSHVQSPSSTPGLLSPSAPTNVLDSVHGTDVPAYSGSNSGMWPAYPQSMPVAGHWQHSAGYNVPPAYPGVPGETRPLYGEPLHYPASGPLYHHPGLGAAPQVNHTEWPTSVPSGGSMRAYYPGAMYDSQVAHPSQQMYPVPSSSQEPSSFAVDPNELRWGHTDSPVPNPSTFPYHHQGGLDPNLSGPPPTFPNTFQEAKQLTFPHHHQGGLDPNLSNPRSTYPGLSQEAEQYEPEPEATEETGGYDPHNWDYPYSVPQDGGDRHW
ncbi:uncharacterized protein FIBRA_02788 [Fibroporia radiculosa]|uniref:Uncharacterized protein n=1 Tax=Fibroporia radiculosa TaxID=599839 RepID=J4G2S1_9APHY|nr:uncharacterized protein FIBRA_02788 [Fibroporia radiculosa]CCM00748.1 predicted protein [Fibroporia radiculosa]